LQIIWEPKNPKAGQNITISAVIKSILPKTKKQKTKREKDKTKEKDLSFSPLPPPYPPSLPHSLYSPSLPLSLSSPSLPLSFVTFLRYWKRSNERVIPNRLFDG
jgi:hypothetical protein